ncbi:hypothetical protein [Bacteroides sp. 519]|uniref:hypothetical protein n=1 Tax=Bacteroides sp. 519 TaxID=2302937 RepID=UPI0013CF427B|nr:hypothetical protein [Bacteroides sp. 519]NDV58883.1 hypothetical protein [Bacteroides sp. 519]
MRKEIINVMFALTTCVFFIGCNNSGSSKSVDIPSYAFGKESYFANHATKSSHAWYGKADINDGTKKFGRYTDGGLLSGMLIEMNEEQFVMLQTKSNLSLTKYLFEDQDEYSVHLIWHDFNTNNPHNAAMQSESAMLGRNFTPLENAYCDSYYFVKDNELAEAKSWIENLNKQPNQQSKYNAKEEGGVKTYKAVIGKVVTYIGQNELKPENFRSVYLDCGAVVNIPFKGTDLNPAKLIDKTIDCVVDAENKVIKYELKD